LFLNDTRNHAKDGTIWLGCELHFLEQRLAANLFTSNASRIVPGREKTIRSWIPARVIRAAQNCPEPIRIFAEHAIQTTPAVGSQDFAPIVFADSRDPVGVQNAAFQKIQPSEKLHALKCKESLRQIRERKVEAPKATLVSRVMDGQNCAEG